MLKIYIREIRVAGHMKKSEHESALSDAAHNIIKEVFPSGRIVFSERGKPEFENLPMHFSISHSGRYAAVAVSDCNIGVDIEKIRPVRRSLAERFISERDMMTRDGFEGEDEFSIRMWSAKEAYLKYTGEGICHIPADVEVAGESVSGKPYAFCRLSDSVGDKYILSLVGDGVDGSDAEAHLVFLT